MKRLILSGFLLATFFASEGCKEKVETKILTQEVRFTKEGELTLKKAANDSIVATLNIEIADDDYQTQTGLMYRKSMQNDQGMLFIFKEEAMLSFYMKNTEFPLDIIYLNSKNTVVSISENAQPFNETSLPSEEPAIYVLEVNAGLTAQWNLEQGDKMEWHR